MDAAEHLRKVSQPDYVGDSRQMLEELRTLFDRAISFDLQLAEVARVKEVQSHILYILNADLFVSFLEYIYRSWHHLGTGSLPMVVFGGSNSKLQKE